MFFVVWLAVALSLSLLLALSAIGYDRYRRWRADRWRREWRRDTEVLRTHRLREMEQRLSGADDTAASGRHPVPL